MAKSLRDLVRDEVRSVLSTLRQGYYVATLSTPDADATKGAGRLFARSVVTASWGAVLKNVVRVAPPIMDVTPKQGARVVVLSKDGNPAFGAIVGQVFDENHTLEDMQAWIRSDQQADSTFLEIGADEVLRLRVGPNKAKGTERGALDPADSVIEIRNGLISIQGLEVDIRAFTLRVNGRVVSMGGVPTL